MKRETEIVRLLAGAVAALLLPCAACVAENRLGLDDGSGVDPGSPTDTNVWAYDLSGGTNCDQLAVASGPVGGPVIATSIKMLNTQDGAGTRVITPASQGAPNMLVRQANGVVAVADLSTVWLFKADGTVLRAVPHDYWVSAMALSVDGAMLVTGTGGTAEGAGWIVHRFEVATGAEIMPRIAALTAADGSVPWITSVAISPDGATIAAGGSAGVRLWRASDGAELAAIPTPTNSVALSAGELAVEAEESVTFYSLAGERLGTYWVPSYPRLAYSGDGTKLAVFTSGQPYNPGPHPFVVKIVNRPAGTEAATFVDETHGAPVPGEKAVQAIGMAFVEADAAVAVGWSDRRVTLFGAADGRTIWTRVLAP